MKELIKEIRSIIENARTNAVRSVDFCRVQMYWNIGRRIVEEEQGGNARAEYGKSLIKNLAKELELEYGSGFSFRQLSYSRKFYLEFPIVHALRAQFNWTQYKTLVDISDKDKREYYELEAAHNCWTAREMQRQINSMLYERLLLSNDKEAVLAMARREKNPETPQEIIFVIFELKTGEVTHQDLGQLQMYVNYYDRVEKLPEENPTIGILLCTAKNDTLVKMTLPADNNSIVASKYQLYLPTEQQLIAEVERIKKEWEAAQ